MRVKTFTNGDYTEGGFTSGGGTMTGPLILAGDPTKDLEASTKQYADSKMSSFDASKFIAGTLQVGRLPAFTGDVVSSTGSSNISLAAIGISPGVYTKVTVNAKGLVTGGSSIVEADLPDLDWTKITSGKPTTIGTYGITDGLRISGGAMTGTLTLSGDPTQSMQAATKQYVDNNASNFSALKTGDIISKLTATTPAGFLKCNGAELSKTTYAALYAVVGDSFSYSRAGAGQPWKQQYDINISADQPATGWAVSGVIPNPKAGGCVFVTNSKVFFVGGYNGQDGDSNQVLTNSLASDGSLSGAWVSSFAFPIVGQGFQAVVTKNRVYLLGGSSDGDALSSIYSTTINADGTINSWSSTGNLPAYSVNPCVFIIKNKLYFIPTYGGASANSSDKVYSNVIASDGTISGTWTTESGVLPASLPSSVQPVVTRNRVYLLGINGETRIFTTTFDGNGNISSAWVQAGAMPGNLGSASIFVTKNRVYHFSSAAQTLYTAPIAADGTLGAWTQSAAAYIPSTLFATSGFLYGSFGYNGSYNSNMYRVPFSGGVNDYSPYYSGALSLINPANFLLPDTTATDLQGAYSFIKI